MRGWTKSSRAWTTRGPRTSRSTVSCSTSVSAGQIAILRKGRLITANDAHFRTELIDAVSSRRAAPARANRVRELWTRGWALAAHRGTSRLRGCHEYMARGTSTRYSGAVMRRHQRWRATRSSRPGASARPAGRLLPRNGSRRGMAVSVGTRRERGGPAICDGSRTGRNSVVLSRVPEGVAASF